VALGHCESWARIPLDTRLFVRVLCVVLFCVGRGFATGWSPPKESEQMPKKVWKAGRKFSRNTNIYGLCDGTCLRLVERKFSSVFRLWRFADVSGFLWLFCAAISYTSIISFKACQNFQTPESKPCQWVYQIIWNLQHRKSPFATQMVA
jgi:hypothetical protein